MAKHDETAYTRAVQMIEPPFTPSPQPSLRASQRPSLRVFKIVLSWLAALLVALALQRFVFQSYQVFGHSMEPTLSEGDYLIISKIGPTWADLRRDNYYPDRGDIVVINSPLDDTRLIKRVIGLPGERITVANGQVRVYNQAQPTGFDPYAALGLGSKYTSGQLTIVVPADHAFVVGDNREAGGSLDSRNDLGPVALDDIIGKLVVRLWPVSKIDSF
ncbi:signal peptidase I [Candidatus Microgenomates bacterium]|nr:signal peptidase I [Candidatus Microgenomates bacterium]